MGIQSHQSPPILSVQIILTALFVSEERPPPATLYHPSCDHSPHSSTAVPSPSAQSLRQRHTASRQQHCIYASGRRAALASAGRGAPLVSPASADPLESSARFPAAPADPIRCLGRKPQTNAAEARYTPIQSWAPRRATAVQGQPPGARVQSNCDTATSHTETETRYRQRDDDG